MNLITNVLFLHVVGMLGLFVALGLEGVSVFRLRRAWTLDELPPWLGLSAGLPRLYRGSLALIMISGVYLMRGVMQGLTNDRPLSQLGWLVLSVAGVIAFAALGGVSLRRIRPLWHADAAPNDQVASLQLARAHDPALPVIFIVRAILAVAIVFLMMSRPPLDTSLGVMAAAAVVAIASSRVAARRPAAKAVS
jgi:uncharacterized membrane protein SirB2